MSRGSGATQIGELELDWIRPLTTSGYPGSPPVYPVDFRVSRVYPNLSPDIYLAKQLLRGAKGPANCVYQLQFGSKTLFPTGGGIELTTSRLANQCPNLLR